MDTAVFDGIAAPLSTHYELHVMPLPGYGVAPCAELSTLDSAAAALAARAPARCCVAGWSLGGQLALAWAHLAPGQVEELILIATTPSFVRRPGWDCAIDSHVIEEFGAALERDPEGTLRRFASLQVHGDAAPAQTLRTLRSLLQRAAPPAHSTLAHGLRLVLETDLRSRVSSLAQRTLLIHGEHDALAPMAAAGFMAQALSSARLVVIPGAAHVPFMSHPSEVVVAIGDFLDAV
jgi:pimeloyl-[acyl-carrier protein] methyl ester esterase